MSRIGKIACKANLIATSLLALCLSACCNLQPGTYRLQAEFERDPIAFRAGNESLAIAVKLQNLSDKPLQVSAGAVRPYGLQANVVVNSTSAFVGRATIVPGLRGGICIESVQNARSAPWLDEHAVAVGELARIGQPLLHLDPDKVRGALDLLGNEADATIIVPIDWSAIPQGVAATPVRLEISIDFSYLGNQGETYVFPGKLQRAVSGYLLDGQRYASGTLPAPNGPLEGEFVPVEGSGRQQ